jgi:hypothetical protein
MNEQTETTEKDTHTHTRTHTTLRFDSASNSDASGTDAGTDASGTESGDEPTRSESPADREWLLVLLRLLIGVPPTLSPENADPVTTKNITIKLKAVALDVHDVHDDVLSATQDPGFHKLVTAVNTNATHT